MPGYSLTPLIKKLGIKPTSKILLLNAPDPYFEWLEADISAQVVKSGGKADIVHVFVKTRKELEQSFASLVKQLHQETVIWISWYKKSAGIVTNVIEDVIRAIVLPHGWVDIKVCAVSDEWSGLKIIKRKALR
jgi:hypothetical protein